MFNSNTLSYSCLSCTSPTNTVHSVTLEKNIFYLQKKKEKSKRERESGIRPPKSTVSITPVASLNQMVVRCHRRLWNVDCPFGKSLGQNRGCLGTKGQLTLLKLEFCVTLTAPTYSRLPTALRAGWAGQRKNPNLINCRRIRSYRKAYCLVLKKSNIVMLNCDDYFLCIAVVKDLCLKADSMFAVIKHSIEFNSS